jgi:hypothetical protein
MCDKILLLKIEIELNIFKIAPQPLGLRIYFFSILEVVVNLTRDSWSRMRFIL